MLYQNQEDSAKRRVNKMTIENNLLMGKNTEAIYRIIRKGEIQKEKREAAATVRRSISCYREYLRRYAAPRECYVFINGISMPVLKDKFL